MLNVYIHIHIHIHIHISRVNGSSIVGGGGIAYDVTNCSSSLTSSQP